MQTLFTNALPLFMTISTAFGVFIHDTQIDQMAATAALPAIVVGYGVADILVKQTDHTHFERAGFNASIGRLHEAQPRVQPRNGDDKKYISQKKYNSTSYGSDYRWPSA